MFAVNCCIALGLRGHDHDYCMTNPRLTIITITKNDPTGLARTLKSSERWRLLPDVEQVIVYAGDMVPDIAANSVKIIRQQSTGIANAFNEGLAFARGEWIWFINGGDAIHENLNSDWLFGLLGSTQAEVVTGALHYDGDEQPHAAPPLRMQWPLITSWLPHPSTLVRRSVLNELGGFDPRWKICMDFDLWYRLFARPTRVDVVAVPFARFDITGLSQSPESRRQLLRENIRVLWKYQGLIWRTCWQKGRQLLYVFLHAAKNIWA